MLTDQSRIKDISDMGKRILTLVDNLLQTVPQFFFANLCGHKISPVSTIVAWNFFATLQSQRHILTRNVIL